jgi:hypothetical protein
MFEIASQDPVWVRIPVYVGDLDKIDLQKESIIEPMGNNKIPNVINPTTSLVIL